ncbi:MAG: trypsin-like serine protease [Gammaproteobacteria bacterium]|nr:trypsin-like serine protease [Gammaproteobacteria bacterium]
MNKTCLRACRGLTPRLFSRPSILFLTSLVAIQCLLPGQVFASDLREKARSVVKLYVASQQWDIDQPWTKTGVTNQVCTGFAIEEGILTNAHCVTDATYVEIEVPELSHRLEAKRVAISHDVDLALLTFADPEKAPKLEPLKLGELPHLRDKVVTIGYPMGGIQVSYTEGVVSRIDVMPYAHSHVTNLLVQTDAAINPGNSGGPVFSDNTAECLGVSTQIARGSSIGYFIPKEVIMQFLDDLKDGHIDGMPGLGVPSQVIESQAIRDFLHMKEDQTGVRITDVASGVPSLKALETDDVVLKVDGHQVMGDGQVTFRDDGKIGFAYYVSTHQIGDILTLTILRDGKVIDVPITLGGLDYRIVPIVPEFERQPAYYEVAGIIFRRLEPRYIDNKNYASFRPYLNKMQGDVPGIHEFVFIGEVYPSELTKGYAGEANKRVVSINGHLIRGMEDVAPAFEKPMERGYHVIFLDDGHRIVLNAAEVAESESAIRRRYGIKEPSQ